MYLKAVFHNFSQCVREREGKGEKKRRRGKKEREQGEKKTSTEDSTCRNDFHLGKGEEGKRKKGKGKG